MRTARDSIRVVQPELATVSGDFCVYVVPLVLLCVLLLICILHMCDSAFNLVAGWMGVYTRQQGQR